jgi:hypothetical protein
MLVQKKPKENVNKNSRSYNNVSNKPKDFQKHILLTSNKNLIIK